MRFKAETYDAELDALLDEFVDARAIEAVGDEQIAWEQIGLLLGIWPGDVIEIDADGYVVTSASSEEIHRRIAIARRYKALPPIPEFPFEREWPDRLRTLTDFLTMGPLVVLQRPSAGRFVGGRHSSSHRHLGKQPERVAG